MRSQEEFEQITEEVESVKTTTWWLMGAFGSTKLLGSIDINPVFSMINFAQMTIF